MGRRRNEIEPKTTGSFVVIKNQGHVLVTDVKGNPLESLPSWQEKKHISIANGLANVIPGKLLRVRGALSPM